MQPVQSPAPAKQRIRRSDSTSEESINNNIKNIEAVTEAEEDKKQEEEESDSSKLTITEDKDSPKTEGGPIKQTATVAAEALAIPASTSGADTSQVGVLSNTSDSSSSSSSSSSST
jgi:hypothetical protein